MSNLITIPGNFQDSYKPHVPSTLLESYDPIVYLVSNIQMELYPVTSPAGAVGKYLHIYSKESYVSPDRLVNESEKKGPITTAAEISVQFLNHTDKLILQQSSPKTANGTIKVNKTTENDFTAKSDGTFSYTNKTTNKETYTITDFGVTEIGGAAGANRWRYFYNAFKSDKDCLFGWTELDNPPDLAVSQCNLHFDAVYKFPADFNETVNIQLGLEHECALLLMTVNITGPNSKIVSPYKHTSTKQFSVDFSKISCGA